MAGSVAFSADAFEMLTPFVAHQGDGREVRGEEVGVDFHGGDGAWNPARRAGREVGEELVQGPAADRSIESVAEAEVGRHGEHVRLCRRAVPAEERRMVSGVAGLRRHDPDQRRARPEASRREIPQLDRTFAEVAPRGGQTAGVRGRPQGSPRSRSRCPAWHPDHSRQRDRRSARNRARPSTASPSRMDGSRSRPRCLRARPCVPARAVPAGGRRAGWRSRRSHAPAARSRHRHRAGWRARRAARPAPFPNSARRRARAIR